MLRKLLIIAPVVLVLILVSLFLPARQVTIEGIGKLSFETAVTLSVGQEAAYAAPAQVTFVAAGTGSGVTGNPTPAYPSGLQANDLILLQVTVRNTTTTPTTPSGFTLLFGPDSTGTGRQWVYYKISNGTESGTITVTIGGVACKIARMYAFRNAATSNFTEGGGFRTGTVAAISAQSVTTTGPERLAVSFVFVNDDNAVGSFTGETGGDWTEAVAEFTTTAGSDGCVQLQTATMATAGTITGGSYTMSAADPWGVRAFAIKSAPPPDISNTSPTGNTYNFGVVAKGSITATGLTYFTVTNNSASAVNITISGTDMTGGVTWTLSNTAAQGANTYGLMAGLGGGDYTITVRKAGPFNNLVGNLAVGASQSWGLQLLAPTSFSDNVTKSATVTLTATYP